MKGLCWAALFKWYILSPQIYIAMFLAFFLIQIVWVATYGPIPSRYSKKRPESQFALFLWGYKEKTAIYKSRSGSSREANHAGILILDLTASRTVRNNCMLFISHPSCGTLLQQPELRQERICHSPFLSKRWKSIQDGERISLLMWRILSLCFLATKCKVRK